MTTIELGRVTRPHGLRGELKIRPFWEGSDALARVRWVELQVAGSARKRLELESARRAGKGWIVALGGVGDRDAAEALAGALVLVERAALGELAEGEYFLSELVGARVFGPAGEVGEIVEVRAHPSLDSAVIRTPAGELVEQPLVEPWLESVDVRARRVVLVSLDGLFA
ncbi:MAG: ribosome maturation factor RimM [Sorangiineae bacterium]|nr:ribosome maturation factor RimM [Polyangiaceae bacterium]MEB2323802.1 ribosome maturation factor RimM [Sorangiineae bacterium]